MRVWLFAVALVFSFSTYGQIDSVQYTSISDSIKGESQIQYIDVDSTILLYEGIGPYNLQQRASMLKERLQKLRSATFTPELKVVEAGNFYEIRNEGSTILSISLADAQAIGLTPKATAEFYAEKLNKAVAKKAFNPDDNLLINIGISVGIIILFLIFLKYYNKLFHLIYGKIETKKGHWFKGVKLKNYEFVSGDQLVIGVVYLAKAIRLTVLLIIVYLLLPTIFSLFPWTQGIAQKLFGYVLNPLKSIGTKFLEYIPNLLAILVIVVVVRFILKGLTFFKNEVARGRLEIPGFYPEWARPTFNLLKTLVVAIAFVAIWPLLPMSDTEVFKGISTFFGILVALGGAGAISNVIAGLVITYMRSFKVGDRVKIGETIGDVTEKSLLNTKVKTLKNEVITIPNSHMLNSHTINYTTANEEEGLILHTTVTIGYDVPWREVHSCLIEAAMATEHIKKLPKPYVLQTSLDDFYVSYQLNARTREIKKMASIYSELHQNIQDKFNEAKIEIMSPHYGAIRDGNQSTIPQDQLPENYQAPWFRLKNH